jgi:hypothetical protein
MKEEGSKMKPELQEWQNQRIAILQKFAARDVTLLPPFYALTVSHRSF